MRIGELAKAADADIDTIRYYEKIGIPAAPAAPISGVVEAVDLA